MSEYSGKIIGDLPPTCRKDAMYFLSRFCFVDCRGPLAIDGSAYFGLGVKVITAGHDLSEWPLLGRKIPKGVTVGAGAWIASFAILHNCVVKAHAIVSIGSVVNGIVVPEYGVAVGNPAKVVGYMHRGVVVPREMWDRIQKEETGNTE